MTLRRDLVDWVPVPVRFAAVGAVNTGVDFLVFFLLYVLADWAILLANSLAFLAAVCVGFLLNKVWTFDEFEQRYRVGHTFFLYLAICAVGLLISNGVVAVLAARYHWLVAKSGAVVATFLWNYWMTRRYVFGSSQESVQGEGG